MIFNQSNKVAGSELYWETGRPAWGWGGGWGVSSRNDAFLAALAKLSPLKAHVCACKTNIFFFPLADLIIRKSQGLAGSDFAGKPDGVDVPFFSV